MTPRPAASLHPVPVSRPVLGLALAALLSGCVTPSQNSTGGPAPDSAPASPALTGPAADSSPRPATPAAPVPPPSPPKPSLAQLTNRERPHLDFHGAKIYADSITGTEAKGNVFLDGTSLHQINRSFPIAVYADHIELDEQKERVTLSGWPIVQTDSAYVQAQAPDTVIVLNKDRMAKIRGPARYVIGNQTGDLFGP